MFAEAHFATLLQHYGYGAVAFVVMLESAGALLPGEAVLLAASLYAGLQVGILSPSKPYIGTCKLDRLDLSLTGSIQKRADEPKCAQQANKLRPSLVRARIVKRLGVCPLSASKVDPTATPITP